MFKKINVLLLILLLLLCSCSEDSDPVETDGDDSPATDGDAADGDTPDGDTSDGDTPDGDTSDGDISDGDTPDGDTSDGDTPDGDTPDGDDDSEEEIDDTPPPESLVEIDGLKILRLKGDDYDRGYTYGKLLGDMIVYFYQGYVLDYVAASFPEEYELARAITDGAVLLTDEESAMLTGLLEGIHENWDATITLPTGTEDELSMSDLLGANVLSDFAQFGCSSVAVWGTMSADGRLMVARNMDWDPGPDMMLGEGTIIVTETPEDESWKLVSVLWPGLIGCYSCMNASGHAAFIHDAPRYHSGIVASDLEPRTFLMRRALMAAEDSESPFTAFEETLEAGTLNSGNNYLFVTSMEGCLSGPPAGAFETDDNEEHEDGFATLRNSLDTEVNGTEMLEAFFTTNHYRKRYDTGSCYRYDNLIEGVEAATDPESFDNPSGDATIDMDDLRWVATQAELSSLTVHTILFRPADMSLKVYRNTREHESKDDPGVDLPMDELFPW